MAGLTAKQAAFVAEYLVDLNASAAAVRAGYSRKTAYSIGEENLKKPEIRQALAEALAERARRLEISQDYVLDGLRLVAERCLEAAPVLDAEGQESGVWRFNAAGANRALELLGRHLGMFREKVEHCGPGGGPIEHRHGVTPQVEEFLRRLRGGEAGC